MRWILPLVLLFAAAAARAEETLLRVELLRVTPTEYTNDCTVPPEQGHECIEWSSWYVYEARIKQVISGTFPDRVVKFAMDQHATFGFHVFSDVFIFLETFKNPDTTKKLGTPFVVDSVQFPREFVCLPAEQLLSLAPSVRALEPAFQFDWGPCMHLSDFADFPGRDSLFDCDEQSDRAKYRQCRTDAVASRMQELVSLERNVFERFASRYEQEPWKSGKAEAVKAFQSSTRAFREYMAHVCAFEGTLSGTVEPHTKDGRAELRLECQYRMIEDRIRLLYEQEFVN